MTRPVAVLALTIVVALDGCTTALYPGPRRPDADVATIEAEQTTIEAIDGRDLTSLPRARRYQVLPGPHSIAVNLDAREIYQFGMIYSASETPATICFVADEGKRYVVTAHINRHLGSWKPQISESDMHGASTTRPVSLYGTCADAPQFAPDR